MRRRFFINLAIGIALLAVLYAPPVANSRVVRASRDAMMGWQMALLRGTGGGERIAWIYVDDETRAKWGYSAFTPRNRIAGLVDFALRGKPAAVIVDYDLSWPQPGDEDASLIRVLRAYQARCVRTCAPVLLVRAYAPNLQLGYADDNRSRREMADVAERSFLDAPLSTDPRRPFTGRGIFWGSADFAVDDDGVVRTWTLWLDSCERAGQAAAVPSLALLAAASATDTPYGRLRDVLQSHAATCVPRNAPRASPEVQKPSTIRMGQGMIEISDERLRNSIFFRIAPRRQGFTGSDSDAASTPANFVMIPARAVFAAQQPDAYSMEGRIVVIGAASSREDIHETPLGMMPGSLVLVNAADTLLHRQLSELPLYGQIMLELALLLLISLLFARFDAAVAAALSLSAIALAVISVGLAFFNAGVWIDFVLPALGVVAHEIVHAVTRRIHTLQRGPYKHEGRR